MPSSINIRSDLDFMSHHTNVLLKVLLLSAGISLLIRYGGPSLPIAPTPINALIAVFTPSLLLAIALAWRGQTHRF